MKSHRAKASFLSLSILALILMPCLIPCTVSAQAPTFLVDGYATPQKVKTGETVTIHINVTNKFGKDVDNYHVQLFVYKGGTPSTPSGNTTLIAMKNTTVPVTFTWYPKDAGTYTIMVLVLDENMLTVGDSPYELTQKIVVEKVATGFRWPGGEIFGIPVIFILVMIVLLVSIGGVLAIRAKRKKKKALVITGEGVEVQGRVAWGKMPENFYKEKRDRLAKLRPVGLTRDGRTIMGNSQIGERGLDTVVEIDHTGDGLAGTKTCPKCGYEEQANSKTCLKCEAIENIKDTKDLMKSPMFQGHNLDFAEVVVRQADAAFEGENFTEANVYSLDARTKIEEYKTKVEADRRAQGEGATDGTETGAPVPGEQKPVHQGPKAPSACLRCGMGMQEDWNKCPVCGMTVEEMLKPREDAPPQEAALVEVPTAQTYTCSTCGNEKESETAACVHCNTGRAISNAEKKVKELRLLVTTIAISSDDQLEVNEAFDLFADAKGAFQDKDYNTAVGLAGETIECVDELVARLGPKQPAPPVTQPKPAPPRPQTPVTMALADNKCPKCGMSVKPTWEICPQCDSPLRAPTPATAAQKICPKCAKPVKDRWTICPFCEGPLK